MKILIIYLLKSRVISQVSFKVFKVISGILEENLLPNSQKIPLDEC